MAGNNSIYCGICKCRRQSEEEQKEVNWRQELTWDPRLRPAPPQRAVPWPKQREERGKERVEHLVRAEGIHARLPTKSRQREGAAAQWEVRVGVVGRGGQWASQIFTWKSSSPTG